MSFTLYPTSRSVAPLRVELETPLKREEEAEELFMQQRKELEEITRRQKQRIQVLRTGVTIDAEHVEGSRHAQIIAEKKSLETELAQLDKKLDDLDVRWQELHQTSEHELRWGQMKSNLSEALLRNSDFLAEIQESQKQLKSVEFLTSSRRERLNTVQRELQQTFQDVKWLLECQVRDEKFFEHLTQEEDDFLRQLIEAQDDMKKDVHQLIETGGRNISPLQEDTEALEVYLEEMQNRRCMLQLRCAEIQQQVEMVKMATHTSEKTLQPLAHQRILENVDLHLIRFVNELLEEARRSHPREELSPSVNSDKKQWLRNYLFVWSRISQECAGLHRRAKAGFGAALDEANRRIQTTQRELSMFRGVNNDDTIERQAAFLFVENLLYLRNQRLQRETELLHRLKESLRSIGDSPTKYIALVRGEGYGDIIGENDLDDAETFTPSEREGELFESMPEQVPEETINSIRSAAEKTLEEFGEEVSFRPMRESYSGRLQTFLLQKDLFLKEQAARQRLEKRSAFTYTDSPETVEDAISRSLEKLIDNVLRFVKNQKKRMSSGSIDVNQNSTTANAEYADEAHAMQIKVDQLLSEHQRVSSTLSSRSNGGVIPGISLDNVFRPIVVETPRLPPDVLGASPAIQARYFLSCVLRGFTAVMLVPGSTIPTVRHIFLNRDMSCFSARGVVDTAGEGKLGTADAVVRLVDVRDINFPTDKKFTALKLKLELSFLITVRTENNRDAYWVVQTDNSESRRFWAYVLAWVVNETAPNNKDAVVVKLKTMNKIFVLDTRGATADSIEPTDRNCLFVQVDEK